MRTQHLITLICRLLALDGCVSRSIDENVPDRGRKVIASRPLPASERMTIAIARFTNESIYGSGLFTDAADDCLGKQAADLLACHLMQTQFFNVVERQDISKLNAEAELMGLSEDQFKQNLQGVDALIVGSVAELERDETGGSWLIGKERTQRGTGRSRLLCLPGLPDGHSATGSRAHRSRSCAPTAAATLPRPVRSRRRAADHHQGLEHRVSGASTLPWWSICFTY